MPALRFNALTSRYDVLTRRTGFTSPLLVRVLDAEALVDGDTLLDADVGTGSLLLLTQRRQPRARAIGADPGGRVLRLARSKVEYSGLAIELLHHAAGRPRVGAY